MSGPGDKLLLSKVNAVPRGLQDFLGNVNQGINPQQLDPLVSPSVDLFPFYQVDNLRARLEVDTGVPGALGFGVDVEVPEGEIWQVIAASASYKTIGAGTDDTSISVGIYDPSLTVMTAIYTAAETNVVGSVGANQTVGGPFPDRLFLSSGWRVRGQVNGTNQVTPRQMTLQFIYHVISG